MSAKHMGQVFDLALSHSQAWVLLAMADHADHRGERVYPSLALLSWKTGFCRRQVQRIIVQLIDLHAIELVQAATGRPGMTDHFRLTFDGLAKKKPIPREPKETGDILSPVDQETGDIPEETGDISHETGDTWMSPESPSRTIIENRTETRAPESPLQGGDPPAERGGKEPPPKADAWDRLLVLLGEAGLAPWDQSPRARVTWGDLLRGRKVGTIRAAIRSARRRMPVTMGTCTPEDLQAGLAEPVGA